MAEKYDNNGYGGGDFKRNSTQDLQQSEDAVQDGEDGPKLNEKAGEYMRDLLGEKIKLNNSKFPISTKLIDAEVARVQATGKIVRDAKYLDVYREKPVKVTVKVLVPVKEHPKFNFVGKLLGPKGNTMKQLQEETMCKMAVLGRGSMRDRQKEEELRNSLDPKYSHLSDELHVEISALAPPAEAHARIAYALAEVKKYLVPDANDMIRQTQMRDIMDRGVRPGPPGRIPPRMPPAPPPMSRPMPAKNKVISILDRARSAMESSYSYDDPYASEPPVRGPPPRAPEPDFYFERSHDRYYEEDYYKEPAPSREFKASAREVGTRRPMPQSRPQPHYARASPYARPPK
ncbi:KH domain-containing, RNA-binding, signal transduction-associated protein 2-like isoform X2 [Hyposmocoma kahamanoa]|nr:KH domain-containing, RNA-binding, signal transduction-associated protein 2-like isoform X2 [Hyposmocoma kahamanoa]